jgi:hypothetical protein
MLYVYHHSVLWGMNACGGRSTSTLDCESVVEQSPGLFCPTATPRKKDATAGSATKVIGIMIPQGGVNLLGRGVATSLSPRGIGV